jgi:hypothetical protein
VSNKTVLVRIFCLICDLLLFATTAVLSGFMKAKVEEKGRPSKSHDQTADKLENGNLIPGECSACPVLNCEGMGRLRLLGVINIAHTTDDDCAVAHDATRLTFCVGVGYEASES